MGNSLLNSLSLVGYVCSFEVIQSFGVNLTTFIYSSYENYISIISPSIDDSKIFLSKMVYKSRFQVE